METQIIVLYAGQYSVEDEVTHKLNEGVTINYYFNTDMEAADNTNGTKGMRPARSSSQDLTLMARIPKAPALYKAFFDMKVDSKGKVALTIVDLEYLTDVAIVTVGTVPEEGKPEEKAKKAG